MTITVMLGGVAVPVDREVFVALFDQSVVRDRAGVRRALRDSSIAFGTLVDLARLAEIPYPLFFAPKDVVEEQLRLKTQRLMAGFTKTSFSMNSRSRVELRDIELIVKDLLRKQQHLKSDRSLVKNSIVGCLRKSGASVAEDAAKLTRALGLTIAEVRAAKNKAAALELLISRLESRQILVSRSSRLYMPQTLPAHAKFSGLTIKDAKVPYIFLASGDEGGDHLEPSGRKVFTLTLLAVLVACGTFAPVTYDGHTTDENSPREYELTAEILMPAMDFHGRDISSLEAIKETADLCKVTPSAVVMRGRGLRMLDPAVAAAYMNRLAEEYTGHSKPQMRNPLPVNALRKYNGAECSRRMLGLLDAGHITPTDFCRVMFSNKLRPAQISDFRAAMR